MKNTYSLGSLLLMGLLLVSAPVLASGGLILPMPGKKAIEKASATVKVPTKQPQPGQQKGSNKVILPLPKQIKPTQKQPQTTPQTTTSSAKDTPLLPIVIPKPEPEPALQNEAPAPPDEVVISSYSDYDDLIPPVPPPPEVEHSGGALPVFPKDTSSAVFMVMKSWQCDQYDGNTLLSHAVEVYSSEADDSFTIEGLSPENEFFVSLEEEDITLDELLDILAMKSGRDWGVDIPSKVIYFYPQGVNTDAYNVW